MSIDVFLLPNPAFGLTSQEIAQSLASSQGARTVSSRKLGLVKGYPLDHFSTCHDLLFDDTLFAFVGSLQQCSATENCFSTSAKAAGKALLPWSYADTSSSSSPSFAWKSLAAAAQSQGLTVLQVLFFRYPPHEMHLLLLLLLLLISLAE